MIEKDSHINNLINLLKNTFGKNKFMTVDHWEESNSIGFQIEDKLIYIAVYDDNDYFYECEKLNKDPKKVFVSQGYDNATKEELLNKISEFFQIERVR